MHVTHRQGLILAVATKPDPSDPYTVVSKKVLPVLLFTVYLTNFYCNWKLAPLYVVLTMMDKQRRVFAFSPVCDDPCSCRLF
jgi:hypothetical protein